MDKQKHKEEKDELQKEEDKEELVWDEGNTERQKKEDTKEEEEEEQRDKDEEEESEEKDDEKQGNTETQKDDTEAQKEQQEPDEDEEEDEEESAHEEIRKSEVLRRDLNKFVRDNQPSYNLTPQSRRPSGKLVTLILFVLTIVVIGGGIYFVAGVGSPKKQQQEETATPTQTPTPTPQALNRSEWSLEVLNGSGVTGVAKKLADQLKELGYQVSKVGNADRDDYETNQLYVREDLADEIDAVVLDIKDIIKIASIAGKLKDSTPSARIIIGKE